MKRFLASFSILLLLAQPFLSAPVAQAATDVKNDASLSTSLVSYWELEEASGTRVDSHGSNDLTDNNTVLSATAVQGDGADFELSNSEYLSITDAAQSGLDLNSDVSIAAWVNFESLPTHNVHPPVLQKWTSGADRSYIFSISGHSTLGVGLRWVVFDGSGASEQIVWEVPISAGTWYHVAMTYDLSAGEAKFYLDGVQQGSTQTGGKTTINTGSAPVTISTGSTHIFDAVLDEVGVWTKVLTSTEVSDLYNSGSGIPYDAGGGGGSTRRIIRTTEAL